MKQKCGLFVVAAVAFLGSILGASAFTPQHQSFTAWPDGTTWTSNGVVTISNGLGVIVSPTNSLAISPLAVVSNYTAGAGDATNQVWTDFWTIPVVFNSDGQTPGPTIDTNATVQFYVNSNGYWTVYSGGDSYVGYKTNVSTVLGTNRAVFCQVSVLSDYANKKFSFFVNGTNLWTDLKFMRTNGVSAAEWFQVQNLGGVAANVCYLDEYLLTNRLGNSVLTNPVPGGAISVADAIQYFGTTNNPAPTNTAVAITNNSAVWTFASVVSGATYQVVGSTVPTGNFSTVSGAIINGSNMVAYLGNGTNRYFEKIVTVSGVDGTVASTDTVVYAAYKQYRAANAYFIVGVPVQYANPNDRTMGGAMGTQLGSGLSNLDEATLLDNGSAFKYTWSKDDNQWSSADGNDAGCTKVWGAGVGVAIKRLVGGGETSSILAGMRETNNVQVAVASAKWVYLSWPYDDQSFNNGSALGFSSSIGDYIYIQTNGATTYIPARFDGSQWKTRLNGTGPALTVTLHAGDGIVYRTTSGGKTFDPVGP